MKHLSGTPNEYLSVIQYGCDPSYSLQGHDNVTFTCEAGAQWKSNTANVQTPFCTPVCGQLDPRVQNEDNGIPKGGFPWQAFLVVQGRPHESATVIGDRWLLTAAHVALEFGSVKDEMRIVVGAIDLSGSSFNFVDAASFHVHPDFRYDLHRELNVSHNIALIKLREPLTFNETVRPLCLPTVETLHNHGTVGKVVNLDLLVHLSQSNPQDQLDIDWTALDDNTCHMLREELILGLDRNVPPLPNGMFCVQHPARSLPMCDGLSGTPFTVKYNGSHWAAGIVSWSFRCSHDTVRYFTKVLNYIDWIRDTMQKNS
ncbi:complement C1r subcomponent-like [Hippocampus zosterae]|uniref:complement C1r subcomponent-like n=1 Tax=Hippocampus zosterae TaxID=109293 RepID=UPI00223DD157|nr:complement C1r subcomponent-like [Hippocampus zosterae]